MAIRGFNKGFKATIAIPLFACSLSAAAQNSILNIFGDYNDPVRYAPDNRCIETNVFQERTLAAGDAGTYTFTYTVGNPPDPQFIALNASGFIKLLDPGAGFAEVGGVPPVSSSPGAKSLSITVGAGDAGKILQWGFANVSTGSQPTGKWYDNLSFTGTGPISYSNDGSDANFLWANNVFTDCSLSTFLYNYGFFNAEPNALARGIITIETVPTSGGGGQEDLTKIPVLPIWALALLAGVLGLVGARVAGRHSR